jgi:hypothetical protein
MKKQTRIGLWSKTWADIKADAKNRVRWKILVEALCSAAEWQDAIIIIIFWIKSMNRTNPLRLKCILFYKRSSSVLWFKHTMSHFSRFTVHFNSLYIMVQPMNLFVLKYWWFKCHTLKHLKSLQHVLMIKFKCHTLKHLKSLQNVLECDIWINVLIQTSALVGPLYIDTMSQL